MNQFVFNPLVIDGETWAVLTPWHKQAQRDEFLQAWGVFPNTHHPLLLMQDENGIGCANMKNKLVAEAIARGVDGVVILDDDCYPAAGDAPRTLCDLIRAHHRCMQPQPVQLAIEVTSPPSRGTPYRNRSVTMPVAASMGYWTHIGDYDALGQLVHGATYPMQFLRETMYRRFFPLCGMNLAFYPKMWQPWCDFIDVPRFDDIWMGWLFERVAYDRGFCFNLAGPLVKHSRQSNVWANLRDEAKYLEENDSVWAAIATIPYCDYTDLRRLLPV